MLLLCVLTVSVLRDDYLRYYLVCYFVLYFVVLCCYLRFFFLCVLVVLYVGGLCCNVSMSFIGIFCFSLFPSVMCLFLVLVLCYSGVFPIFFIKC